MAPDLSNEDVLTLERKFSNYIHYDPLVDHIDHFNWYESFVSYLRTYRLRESSQLDPEDGSTSINNETQVTMFGLNAAMIKHEAEIESSVGSLVTKALMGFLNGNIAQIVLYVP